MIVFKSIELSDKTYLDQKFKEADFRGCEYSFVNNFIWQETYHNGYADVLGFCCVKGGKGESLVYNYPAGSGDIAPVIEELKKDAKQRGNAFQMRGITTQGMAVLEEKFPGEFAFTLVREECDYIYEKTKLELLSGKKYHGKRNHIARFKDNPNWAYEPITKDNLAECFEMNQKWCKLYDCFEDEGLKHEYCAVKKTFASFFDIGVQGGMIRRDGEIIAYSIGEPLNSDTFVVHIEKAFSDIQGAYPIINQEFVKHNCQNFKYVNREEDMGDEGLRKAKLSYRPELLLEKYIARRKEEL